jgi:hypothetical protein
LGFALQHGCPFLNQPRRHNIDDFHPDEIATAQFAVDGHIEKNKVAMAFG